MSHYFLDIQYVKFFLWVWSPGPSPICKATLNYPLRLVTLLCVSINLKTWARLSDVIFNIDIILVYYGRFSRFFGLSNSSILISILIRSRIRIPIKNYMDPQHWSLAPSTLICLSNKKRLTCLSRYRWAGR